MRIFLVLLTAALLNSCSPAIGEDDAAPPLKTRQGSFTNQIVLSGELEAARGDAIAVPGLPSWQTSIKWIAPEGTEVKQGERVVELDNSTFATDLDSKKQSELQSRQELQQREAEWSADAKQKELDLEKRSSEVAKAKLDAAVPAEVLSAREYEERQTRLRRAEVEEAKARDVLRSRGDSIDADRSNLELRLQQARREISRSMTAIDSLVLTAPRDGIVVLRDLPFEPRKLQAGDTVFVGFPLALLPEMSSLRVAALLADVDDGRLRLGMKATVTLDAYPELQFTGTVASISAVAQESSRQSLRRAFKVAITLDRIDMERMRPGLSARVVIREEAVRDAVLIPRAALDLSGKNPRVRLDGGKVANVKLGSCNAQECVATSGVKAGQELEPFHQGDNDA